jgi:glyoxylase-like metal-dependent hydrolase (beta-lactamase superfamily II)
MDGLSVGSVRVLPLSDGEFAPAVDNFFPDLPAAAWDAYRADHLLEGDRLPLNFGCFLLEADGRAILVDTGVGPVRPPALEGGGHLMEALREVGIDPDTIAYVLLTHFHPDHIGGNTAQRDGAWTPAFPRARYLAQRGEWEHWSHQEAPAVLMDRAVRPLLDDGRLELVDGERAVTASVTLLPTPGHTPGHESILIRSGGEGAVILGDILHTPAQVPDPDRSVRHDIDKEQARATRRAMWDRIEAHGLIVCAGHMRPPNTVGRLVRVEGKRHWQALMPAAGESGRARAR